MTRSILDMDFDFGRKTSEKNISILIDSFDSFVSCNGFFTLQNFQSLIFFLTSTVNEISTLKGKWGCAVFQLVQEKEGFVFPRMTDERLGFPQ